MEALEIVVLSMEDLMEDLTAADLTVGPLVDLQIETEVLEVSKFNEYWVKQNYITRGYKYRMDPFSSLFKVVLGILTAKVIEYAITSNVIVQVKNNWTELKMSLHWCYFSKSSHFIQ